MAQLRRVYFKRRVLTAAHCIYRKNMKEMSIVVGTHTINKGGDRYKIKKLISHEKYSSESLKNDIAIVQIEGKFKYSDKVQPVELLNEKVPIGKKCLLTGWGLLNYRRQTVPNNLQMLEYKTISNDDCNKQFKRLPSQKLLPVGTGQLCAKSPNRKGACSGDSGGPLVIQDNKNKTVQIGIVSWVVYCAKDFPDVFDSVHGFYDWIQSKIKLITFLNSRWLLVISN
ncbi:chymotrypsin-2-like [Pieris napi]|uniref:chymotrypsin-2-like n=1 Tax=Pieris napi TaxID=78633 RepID=UPI001FBA586E|nr:chymotrypsin-2-like [Pieris napi]XP_047526433.1 chymotrypsin-2-like [Pieris napi]XP_047526434.1 chymotrypsin-2-like [Pieris napi]